jgi:signal transduction histidine kinase
MRKNDYIHKNLDEEFRRWLRRASVWGSLLFLTLGVRDYVAAPEHSRVFLLYRLCIASLLMTAFALSRRLPARWLYAVGFLMVMASAGIIEIMIVTVGPNASTYFVGMILLVVTAIGLVPAPLLFHVSIAVLVQLIYVIPLLVRAPVAGRPELFINSMFLSLVSSTMLFLRYVSGKALEKELGLRYDLEQHRGRLEEVVAERTAELAGAIDKLRTEMTERKRSERQRQRLQEQLLQVQKMESIGRLAGGVAHDFNNILTAIMSYAELSLMKLPADHPVWDQVAAIRDACERASSLTHQLLAFSRKQVLEMSAVDLNGVIEAMATLLKRLIEEDINLQVRPRASRSIVRADRAQIEQVVMNLAVNARDAMPTGGELVIETSSVSSDDTFLRDQEVRDADTFVLLTVTDTGEGMSREVRERIFDPFFTTKEQGKGTGLGLATVYGIVQQHGGHVTVNSELGKGTTFRVYLPVIGSPDQEQGRDDQATPPAA